MPREAMNLSYLADQMKQFPNATYTVNGYADSATGTPAFNKELSLKRAQAVVDVLVKQYGIPADRLKVDAGGGVDKFEPCSVGEISQLGDGIKEISYKLLATKDEGHALP